MSDLLPPEGFDPPNPMAWAVMRNEQDPMPHTVPLNDLKEHTRYDCWCNPRMEGDAVEGACVVHNSYDQREHTYERGVVQ